MNYIQSEAPKEAWDFLRREIHNSFHNNSYEEGLRIDRALIDRWRNRACLQYLRVPHDYHKRARTTNLLERLHGEHRRRLKVIPHLLPRSGRQETRVCQAVSSISWVAWRLSQSHDRRALNAQKQTDFSKPLEAPWTA